jgi:hypothetical protein
VSRAPRFLVVGALALALAGCAVQPPAPSEPTAIAGDCRTLVNAINDSVHEMSQLSAEEIAADPEGAIDVLDGTIDSIQTAADAATTPEIQQAASDTVKIMRDYSATLRRTGGKPSDQDKILISAQATLVQDQLEKVAALCS